VRFFLVKTARKLRVEGAALTRGELHEDAVHGEAGEPLGDEVHEIRHIHVLPRPQVPR